MSRERWSPHQRGGKVTDSPAMVTGPAPSTANATVHTICSSASGDRVRGSTDAVITRRPSRTSSRSVTPDGTSLRSPSWRSRIVGPAVSQPSRESTPSERRTAGASESPTRKNTTGARIGPSGAAPPAITPLGRTPHAVTNSSTQPTTARFTASPPFPRRSGAAPA